MRSRLVFAFRLRHLLERRLEHLIHLADKDKLQVALYLGWHLIEIRLVSLRYQHSLDGPRAPSP